VGGNALPDLVVFRSYSNESIGGVEITEVSLQLEVPDGGLVQQSNGAAAWPGFSRLRSVQGLMIEGRRGEDGPRVEVRCEITGITRD